MHSEKRAEEAGVLVPGPDLQSVTEMLGLGSEHVDLVSLARPKTRPYTILGIGADPSEDDRVLSPNHVPVRIGEAHRLFEICQAELLLFDLQELLEVLRRITIKLQDRRADAPSAHARALEVASELRRVEIPVEEGGRTSPGLLLPVLRCYSQFPPVALILHCPFRPDELGSGPRENSNQVVEELLVLDLLSHVSNRNLLNISLGRFPSRSELILHQAT